MPGDSSASASGADRSLNVVVGITGGIAAYKAVAVVRLFVLAGHSVQVVATDAALRFVGRPTLEAISRNPVHSELYEGVAEVRHVAIGQAADLVVVAPATANTIAKLAAGLADDLLGNTILASRAPLVIAPAMHTEMWQHAATTANIATLRARGVTVVGPASGQLTGTDSGPGRMEEPEEIVRAALALFRSDDAGLGAVGIERPRDLTGRTVVVTAGGTREPLDPVRFLGNRSSGSQGVAIALAAAARGATVCLIAAHLEVDRPDVRIVDVETADQLRSALAVEAAGADLVIMAAAVADFRPAVVTDHKLKKSDLGERVTLELVRNPDILAELAHGTLVVPPTGQVIVGFAAETEPDDEQLLALARAKLAAKGTDFLVVNRVGWTEGFGSVANRVTVLRSGGAIVGSASGDKVSVAHAILDAVAPLQPGAQ